MDFSLRDATPRDLDAIMALETAGFAPGIVEEREVFARRVDAFPEGFLLAGEPAWGYACAELWAGWSLADRHRFDLGHDLRAYLDLQGTSLYLASMTVAPSQRGTGLGRALFRASLERWSTAFPRLREVVLLVNEHWHPARAIYRAEGFREVGRFEGFFEPTTGPLGAALVLVRSV